MSAALAGVLTGAWMAAPLTRHAPHSNHQLPCTRLLTSAAAGGRRRAEAYAEQARHAAARPHRSPAGLVVLQASHAGVWRVGCVCFCGWKVPLWAGGLPRFPCARLGCLVVQRLCGLALCSAWLSIQRARMHPCLPPRPNLPGLPPPNCLSPVHHAPLQPRPRLPGAEVPKKLEPKVSRSCLLACLPALQVDEHGTAGSGRATDATNSHTQAGQQRGGALVSPCDLSRWATAALIVCFTFSAVILCPLCRRPSSPTSAPSWPGEIVHEIFARAARCSF